MECQVLQAWANTVGLGLVEAQGFCLLGETAHDVQRF